MKKLTPILLLALIIAVSAVAAIQSKQRQSRSQTTVSEVHAVEAPHPHIISLVPAITETLYMLGLGSNIVGRSTYCNFPPVVTNLPALGSLANINVEEIARLKPDFVLLSDSQAQSKIHTALAKLKINHLGIPANSFSDIHQSVWELAERFGAQDRATLWLDRINTICEEAKQNAPAKPPRILVCAGRDAQSFDRIYIAGKKNFYSDLIHLVGGVNAYTGEHPYPMVSLEGVIQMNPDIIIDIIITDDPNAVPDTLFQWSQIPSVKAIQTASVHIITEDWAVRPGPRIDQLLKTLSNYVSDWNNQQ